MKKTLIALLALGSVAMADVSWIESGSVELTTNEIPGWTLNGDAATVYNYLYGTFNQGGKLVLTMNLNYDGGDCGKYQSLLHVGQLNTGFSVYVNGTTNLIISEKHNTNQDHEIQTPGAKLTAGENSITITLQGLLGDDNQPNGMASVTVAVSDGAPANLPTNLSWQAMSWNAQSLEECTKYSIGCKAPGYKNENNLQKISILNDGKMFMAYTARSVPEPTTGALSLLALAGLCVRRRKK